MTTTIELDEGEYYVQSRYATARVSPSGYLYNLGVHVDHRGNGHGTALMRDVCAFADRLALTLTLHCRDALVRWYEQLGFVRADIPGLPGTGVGMRRAPAGS